MGSQSKNDCPFDADNARKRREEMQGDRDGMIDTGMGDGIRRDDSETILGCEQTGRV